MATPVADDGKRWERTVSLGQFVVATAVLALGLMGAFVQGRIQAAVADERISAITQSQMRMQNQLDTMQQQNTALLLAQGKLQGSVETLTQAITGEPKGKR